MSRIQVVTFEDEQYIVDTYEGYNVAYEDDDLLLEQPIGTWNADDEEINFVEIDPDDEAYQELEAIHDEIRKIDPLAVEAEIKLLQMDTQLPKSEVVEMDDPMDDTMGTPEPTKLPDNSKVLEDLDLLDDLTNLEGFDLSDL